MVSHPPLPATSWWLAIFLAVFQVQPFGVSGIGCRLYAGAYAGLWLLAIVCKSCLSAARLLRGSAAVGLNSVLAS